MDDSNPTLVESLERLIHANKKLSFGVLLVCMLAYLGMLYGIPLAIDGLYAGDMTEHLAWTNEFVEPGALGASPSSHYQRVSYSGLGIRLLYRLGVPLLGVERFGELLALLLGASTIAIGFVLGRSVLGGKLVGGFVASFTLAALARPVSINMWGAVYGGLPRSFGLPLLLGGIAALWRCAPRAFAVIVVLSASVYPPVFLLLTGTVIVLELSRRRPPPLWAALSILSGLVLIFATQMNVGAEFGAPVTWAQAISMPLLSATGMYPVALTESRLGSMLAAKFGIPLLPTGILVASAIFARASLERFRVLFSLAAVGIASFILAYLLFFRMYYPSRFTAWSLGVSSWVAAVILVTSALRRIRLKAGAARAGAIICICVWCALVFVNTIRIYPGRYDAGHTGLYRSPLTPSVCNAIHLLPASSMFAAPLDEAGDVAFLCRRGVLLQFDDLFPYRQKYFSEALARGRAVLGAMTSARWEDVLVLRSFGVTHVLVDRQNLVPSDDAWLRSYEFLRQKPARLPAVLNPPRGAVFFDDGRFEILALVN